MKTFIIKYLTLAVALGFGALNPQPAAAQAGMPCSTNNLLINSSFEDGTFINNGDGCQTLLLNATTMTGWTVISDEIARCQTPNIVNIPASHGSMFLDLSGYDNNLPHGGVQQTVTTVQGQTYKLAFDLGVVQNSPGLTGPIVVKATVTGSPAQSFTHNPSGTGVQWANYGFTFIAGPSTTVTIEGVSGDLYIGLDNVSLCAQCCTNSCNFVNGDFTQSVPVNSAGGGWTSTGLYSGAGWQPSGGNPGGTLLLNNVGAPNTDPTVSQQLCCLVPGRCYTIHGQRKVHAWLGFTAPSFAVLLDGAPILTLAVPSVPPNANWHNFSVSFIATNSCQTIGFAAEYNGTDVSYFIDNIRLECCNNTCIVAISCPADLAVITCRSNAVVTYPTPTAVSSCGGATNVVCVPPSGSTFPFGSTTVTCTATDAQGNTGFCTFVVTVAAPTLNCPNPLVVYTSSTSGANVSFNVTASGNTGPVTCMQPSGSLFSIGTTTVNCSATNACGGVTSCSFQVVVKPYGPPPCNPPCDRVRFADGLAESALNGSILAVGPDDIKHLSQPSDGTSATLQVELGGAQKFTFTTVLDMAAPNGATIEIVDPSDPGGPWLTFTKVNTPNSPDCPDCRHWNVKENKTARISAVSTNAELYGSFIQTASESSTNAPLALYRHDADASVSTKVPIQVTCDRTDGTVEIAFAGSVERRGGGPNGWSGKVVLRDFDLDIQRSPVCRVTFTPIAPYASTGQVMNIVTTGLAELLLTGETIRAMGRPIATANDQAVLYQATPAGDGVSFTSAAENSGIAVDLGCSKSFAVDCDFGTNRVGDSVEFLVSGPVGPLTLTDGPFPPFLSVGFRQTADGVACSADFTYLGAVAGSVCLYSNGSQVAEFPFVGPAAELLLGRAPDSFSQTDTNGTVVLRNIELVLVDALIGYDEIRIIPELPVSTLRPAACSQLVCVASTGKSVTLRHLTRTPACPAPVLLICCGTLHEPPSSPLRISWPGQGYRLFGAEEVTGPWLDLGVEGPIDLPGRNGQARFYRAVER